MRPADTLSCRVGSLLQHSVSQRHLEAHQVAVGVLHEELANTRLLARTEAVPLRFRLHEQGPGRLTELPELHQNRTDTLQSVTASSGTRDGSALMITSLPERIPERPALPLI